MAETIDRLVILNEIREELLQNFLAAKDDLDAVDRMIAFIEDIPEETASVSEVVNTARAVLESKGKMHRNELLDDLLKQGITVAGDNKLGNLSAILSRHYNEFVSEGKGIWKLKQEGEEDLENLQI